MLVPNVTDLWHLRLEHCLSRVQHQVCQSTRCAWPAHFFSSLGLVSVSDGGCCCCCCCRFLRACWMASLCGSTPGSWPSTDSRNCCCVCPCMPASAMRIQSARPSCWAQGGFSCAARLASQLIPPTRHFQEGPTVGSCVLAALEPGAWAGALGLAGAAGVAVGPKADAGVAAAGAASPGCCSSSDICRAALRSSSMSSSSMSASAAAGGAAAAAAAGWAGAVGAAAGWAAGAGVAAAGASSAAPTCSRV